MDMAKLIKIFSGQAHPLVDYINGGRQLTATELPMVAIPTTAGSGSQATHFAVLYVGKEKYSVAHRSMLPDYAIVDPNLLVSLPKAVFASTGLDALNQGIESYWSIHSTNESRDLASEAISLVWQNILPAVNNRDEEARLKMAIGAHKAGEAINITKTTAPHAISYPITSYFGVPHGHAVGLVMSQFFEFNFSVSDSDCLDPRGPQYVKDTMLEIMSLLGQESIADCAKAYNRLMDELALERHFEQVGICTHEDLELIVRNGFNPQRVNNNPRRLTERSLWNILGRLHR